jgi:hypothetical protein
MWAISCASAGGPAEKDKLADLDIVQTAILTLLALIVGFSFSMAVSRYDQRKNYEEASRFQSWLRRGR